MTTGCPHCGARMRYGDQHWVSCLMCGHVIRDIPTMTEKMASNSKLSTEENRTHHVNRVSPETPDQIRDRVMANIRAQAGGGL